MSPYRRTQPLRATGSRRQSRALNAAQRGRPAFMANPMDARRKAMKRRRRRPRGLRQTLRSTLR